MERHCSNARMIAEYLQNSSKVDQVFWPGLEDHPNHNIARSQMKDFGGMLSFTLKEDTQSNAFKTLESFRLFSLAESLGGVESLCGHPSTMTHASIPIEERLQMGIKDSMIRLSIGIEDPMDLLEDIELALSLAG